MYKKDCKQQSEKVEGMRASGEVCCPHELAQQIKVMQETELMIRECEKKLDEARDDLREFLVHPFPQPCVNKSRLGMKRMNSQVTSIGPLPN